MDKGPREMEQVSSFRVFEPDLTIEIGNAVCEAIAQVRLASVDDLGAKTDFGFAG